MRCKDSKQHHVMFHELYSVSLRLCIAQNVRFEIPYKVLYFETPFLIIFKCYAWVSCDKTKLKQLRQAIFRRLHLSRKYCMAIQEKNRPYIF